MAANKRRPGSCGQKSRKIPINVVSRTKSAVARGQDLGRGLRAHGRCHRYIAKLCDIPRDSRRIRCGGLEAVSNRCLNRLAGRFFAGIQFAFYTVTRLGRPRSFARLWWRHFVPCIAEAVIPTRIRNRYREKFQKAAEELRRKPRSHRNLTQPESLGRSAYLIVAILKEKMATHTDQAPALPPALPAPGAPITLPSLPPLPIPKPSSGPPHGQIHDGCSRSVSLTA